MQDQGVSRFVAIVSIYHFGVGVEDIIESEKHKCKGFEPSSVQLHILRFFVANTRVQIQGY